MASPTLTDSYLKSLKPREKFYKVTVGGWATGAACC